MTTPTTYNLSYDSPCDVESQCGDVPCGGKPQANPRPQIFCKDVNMLQTLTVQGKTSVVPSEITVGGLTFKPTIIEAYSGTHLVLAVY